MPIYKITPKVKPAAKVATVKDTFRDVKVMIPSPDPLKKEVSAYSANMRRRAELWNEITSIIQTEHDGRFGDGVGIEVYVNEDTESVFICPENDDMADDIKVRTPKECAPLVSEYCRLMAKAHSMQRSNLAKARRIGY